MPADDHILGLRIFTLEDGKAVVREDDNTLQDGITLAQAKAFCIGYLYALRETTGGNAKTCNVYDTNFTIVETLSSDAVTVLEGE